MQSLTGTGFVWHELMTTDLEGARRFYQEVTGLDVGTGPYPILSAATGPVGGLVGSRPDGPTWPSGGPEPHWVAYFGTPDVDAAVATAQRLGGHVLLPPVDIPGTGRAAVLRDPQGGVFGVFAPAG